MFFNHWSRLKYLNNFLKGLLSHILSTIMSAKDETPWLYISWSNCLFFFLWSWATKVQSWLCLDIDPLKGSVPTIRTLTILKRPAAAAESVLFQEPLLLGPVLGHTGMVERQHLGEPKQYICSKTLAHATASKWHCPWVGRVTGKAGVDRRSSLAFKGAGTETACSQ